ncbi:MAG: EAL domain-containing protein [Lachnospiraceae bacterium]|nr:EAL domain-containing protein [Lachnospiraceae bacterium]
MKTANNEYRIKQLEKQLRKAVLFASSEDSVKALMEFLGKALRAERLMVVEKSQNGKYRVTREWCTEGAPSKKKIQQDMNWDDVRCFYQYFLNDENVAIDDIGDIKEEDSALYEYMAKEGLTSMMAGQLIFEGTDLGYWKIENLGAKSVKELSVLANIMSIYVASLIHSKHLRNRIEHIGYYDKLTGTGNRRALVDCIDKISPGSRLAVFYISFYELRVINETRGTQVGNDMLVIVSDILTSFFGTENTFRICEDEFICISRNIEKKEIGNIIRTLKAQFNNNSVSASMGAVFEDFYQGNFEELMLEADTHVYEEKKLLSGEETDIMHATDLFDEMVEVHPLKDTYRTLYSRFGKKTEFEYGFYKKLKNREMQFVHPLDQVRFREFWNQTNMLEALKHRTSGHSIYQNFRIASSDGQWKWYRITVILLAGNVDDPTFLCFSKQFDEKLDPVGDIESHEIFAMDKSMDIFSGADNWLHSIEAPYICTIACDINNFKLYNDIFGRRAGDKYLKLFNDEMTSEMRKWNGRVEYLNGDNFCMIFPMHKFDQDKIRNIINQRTERIDFKDGFSPSFGVYISSDRNEYMTERYDKALVALANIRGNFSNHICFYDESSYQKMRNTQLLLMDATKGLQEGEFCIYLQPKVEIETGRIIGSEALVRWMHNGEIVPPGEFVEAMENNGYIVAVDRHIWEEVCKWLKNLSDRGIEPLPASVNVSRIDIHFMDIASYFDFLVNKYEIKPEWLEIEITESAYSENSKKLDETIKTLHEYGFKILLDDFGSGYSSLNMLKSINIDVLKMDRKFLLTQNEDPKSMYIIESVVSMANLLDMTVITEGVETEEQCRLLTSIGCKYCQGFYFYKPMPVSEFEALVEKQRKDSR